MKSFLTKRIQSTLAVVCLALIAWNVSAELDMGYEQTKKVGGLCPDIWTKEGKYDGSWGFAACNCTSYVAYRLNLNGVQFTNTYDSNGGEGGQVSSWSHAKNWSNVASVAGIRVDKYPAVGSVAQWDAVEIAGGYGHVAYVYKINTHGDGSLASIEVAEYNYVPGVYDIRTLTPGVKGYPGRFLHFEDKVSSNQPRATCVTTGARNLPGGFGPFCWAHGQYSALCEYATNWYYFDQQNKKFYTLSSSSCPTSDTGGQGGGYGTTLDANALQSGSGGVEAFNPQPITGGKNSGALPDLVVPQQYLVLNDGDKTPITQLHIGDRSNCAIQIKNVGNKGAYDDFQNRCYLSKGKWQDRNPPSPGKATIKGSDGLKSGISRFVYIQIEAFDYPGFYNLTACANTHSTIRVKESDSGNNCKEEYPFEVVSNPDVAVTNIDLSGKTIFQTNEPFSFNANLANLGENFGTDAVQISYTIDGNFVGFNQIRRENLKGGMSKVEGVALPQGIATVGMHTARVCIDYDNRISADTNKSNNCQAIPFLVWSPTTPGSALWQNNGITPIELSCGKPPVEPDFTLPPIVQTGDIGAVITGSNRQRLYIPPANANKIGSGFWNAPTLDPTKIVKWCWGSNQTGWGINGSNACGIPVLQPNGAYTVDISKTPRASKGTWSLGYKNGSITTEYWANTALWTDKVPDMDGHLQYGGWAPNSLYIATDANGYQAVLMRFGVFGLPGFWLPPNAIATNQIFFRTTTDSGGGVPGDIACSPATGKLYATITGVIPGTTGRVVVGTTAPNVYGWQTTDWLLQAGTSFVDAVGNYTISVGTSNKSYSLDATYDKGAKRLTLTLPNQKLFSRAFWNADDISKLTNNAVFQTWIGTNRYIRGTVNQPTANGTVTIVFEGIASGEGGNVYIVRSDSVASWQNDANWNFGNGIMLSADKSSYVMP